MDTKTIENVYGDFTEHNGNALISTITTKTSEALGSVFVEKQKIIYCELDGDNDFVLDSVTGFEIDHYDAYGNAENQTIQRYDEKEV